MYLSVTRCEALLNYWRTTYIKLILGRKILLWCASGLWKLLWFGTQLGDTVGSFVVFGSIFYHWYWLGGDFCSRRKPNRSVYWEMVNNDNSLHWKMDLQCRSKTRLSTMRCLQCHLVVWVIFLSTRVIEFDENGFSWAKYKLFMLFAEISILPLLILKKYFNIQSKLQLYMIVWDSVFIIFIV